MDFEYSECPISFKIDSQFACSELMQLVTFDCRFFSCQFWRYRKFRYFFDIWMPGRSRIHTHIFLRITSQVGGRAIIFSKRRMALKPFKKQFTKLRQLARTIFRSHQFTDFRTRKSFFLLKSRGFEREPLFRHSFCKFSFKILKRHVFFKKKHPPHPFKLFISLFSLKLQTQVNPIVTSFSIIVCVGYKHK